VGHDINNIVNPVPVQPVTIAVMPAVTGTVTVLQGTVPFSDNLAQINGVPVSVMNPLPMLQSDGVSAIDVGTMLRQLLALQAAQTQLLAANIQIAGTGFVPIEVPSFLGSTPLLGA